MWDIAFLQYERSCTNESVLFLSDISLYRLAIQQQAILLQCENPLILYTRIAPDFAYTYLLRRKKKSLPINFYKSAILFLELIVKNPFHTSAPQSLFRKTGSKWNEIVARLSSFSPYIMIDDTNCRVQKQKQQQKKTLKKNKKKENDTNGYSGDRFFLSKILFYRHRYTKNVTQKLSPLVFPCQKDFFKSSISTLNEFLPGFFYTFLRSGIFLSTHVFPYFQLFISFRFFSPFFNL